MQAILTARENKVEIGDTFKLIGDKVLYTIIESMDDSEGVMLLNLDTHKICSNRYYSIDSLLSRYNGVEIISKAKDKDKESIEISIGDLVKTSHNEYMLVVSTNKYNNKNFLIDLSGRVGTYMYDSIKELTEAMDLKLICKNKDLLLDGRKA